MSTALQRPLETQTMASNAPLQHRDDALRESRVLFAMRWCSCRKSVADALLLGCCPPHVFSMIRSPSSLSDPPFAHAHNAHARIFRPIRAEMAENGTI